MLGDYLNKRCNIYANLLKLYRIDLNNINFEKKKNLLTILEKAKINYIPYISKNIINDRNKSGIIQVIDLFKLR